LYAKGYFYLHGFKKLGNSSYFFAAIYKIGPFCFAMLGVSVCFIFVVVEVVF
jgi:hypothetical protein